MAYSLNDLANAGKSIEKHFEDKSRKKGEQLADSFLNTFGIETNIQTGQNQSMQMQNSKYIKRNNNDDK